MNDFVNLAMKCGALVAMEDKPNAEPVNIDFEPKDFAVFCDAIRIEMLEQLMNELKISYSYSEAMDEQLLFAEKFLGEHIEKLCKN